MTSNKYLGRDSAIAVIVIMIMVSTGVIDVWDRSPPQANDLDLVSKVAARLIPPSTLPYNLSKPNEENWGQASQVRFILALTRNKTGGFFIETGAYDGELMSNTLSLERRFGWTGVLIEPSRTLFPRLMQKHRRAWALKACCSQTGVPFQAVFRDQVDVGFSSIEDGLAAQSQSDYVNTKILSPNQDVYKYSVDCFPLYTVLLALNRTSVDFLSLDVEGVEMGVLAFLPWHLLNIKIILAEYFMGVIWNPQTEQMRWFMEQQGYLALRVNQDWVFVKKDSEYADGAAEIVRSMRQQLASTETNSGALERFHNPFND